MRQTIAALAVALLLLCGRVAWAHRIDEYLQATMITLGAKEMQASMRLIPGVLVAPSVIAGIDSDGDGIFSEGEKHAYAERVLRELSVTVDGRRVSPVLRTWQFPEPGEMREGLGEIRLEYAVDLPVGGSTHTLAIANYHLRAASVYLMNAVVPGDDTIRIEGQRRDETQSVYELNYEERGALASSGRGFPARLMDVPLASLFRLGMWHIAEGTDHLLFLLVLLLPAPLLAVGSRWGRTVGTGESLLHILRIVTAFTVGHSVTLGLAAMRVVRVPGRAVEVLIAVSILVSAIHAIRPMFPGREAWIAGSFGLIHGLAFAGTLDRLGLSHWQRVEGVLAFNLGIETMQMVVVVAVLPSLLMMSGTGAYRVVRLSGAVFAGVASRGWMGERLFEVRPPVDLMVNALASHGVWIAGGLFLVGLGCRSLRVGRPVVSARDSVPAHAE